jgi:acyl-CoA synthetase (AMP-forming)/AMP-acid ligase II
MDELDLLTLKDLLFKGNQNTFHPAIESPGLDPLSYHDLREQITSTVRSLNHQGMDKKSRIALVTPNSPVTGVLILSVMTGFTCAPLNPQYRQEEYERYFAQFRIDTVIVQMNDNPAARAAAAHRGIPVIEMIPEGKKAGRFTLEPSVYGGVDAAFASAEDIAILLQTSGTTSTPKVVPLAHHLICKVARRVCSTFGFTAADRCLHIAPYYHTMGVFGNFIAPLCAGGTVICTQDFIVPDLVPLLKTYRPTFYSAGPAVHRAILRELKKVPPEELRGHSLRFIRSASAALSDQVRDELEQVLGIPLIESYGMSEVGGAISTNLPPAKRGSVGKPVIEQLAILDENGIARKPLEEGEIAVRGDVVFTGYDDSPEENATLFTNGWFRTGDIGYLDSEGYLYLTGRKKELINKGGEKIAPVEIDFILMNHPAVSDAMSFRIEDPVLGEDIAAMVVRRDFSVTEKELRHYLLDHISPSKLPRKIYFVDTIPKSPTGKPLRYRGTQQYS